MRRTPITEKLRTEPGITTINGIVSARDSTWLHSSHIWRVAVSLLLEELLEGARVPHVLRGQRRVPLAVPVARLDRVIAEVHRLLQVTQRKLLRAETQITLPETRVYSHRSSEPQVTLPETRVYRSAVLQVTLSERHTGHLNCR